MGGVFVVLAYYGVAGLYRVGTGLLSSMPPGWARQVQISGAVEILLTSKDRVGTQDGYDIPATKAITDR